MKHPIFDRVHDLIELIDPIYLLCEPLDYHSEYQHERTLPYVSSLLSSLRKFARLSWYLYPSFSSFKAHLNALLL